ncbi:metallophosphoesterase [bacterium]|nr:metallophosphoesterase [bacterium]
MKKFLISFIFLLISSTLVFSADMRFIQVDGVLYESKYPQKLSSLIEKINQEKGVEFIVFSGNNIAKPNRDELKNFLKEAKKLKKPYYIVLGQKDVNKNKDLGKDDYIKIVKKNVRAHKFISSPNYVFKKKDLIFIVADGSKEIVPTSSGYYKEDVILWLDEQLDKYNDKKVIILQHYPLIPPVKKETHYTYKAEDYLKLLSEHNNVKALVAGHFNVNKEEMVNNIIHISTKNAPTYRIIDILDYDTPEPIFWSVIKE